LRVPAQGVLDAGIGLPGKNHMEGTTVTRSSKPPASDSNGFYSLLVSEVSF
jgi:hypothetical protein